MKRGILQTVFVSHLKKKKLVTLLLITLSLTTLGGCSTFNGTRFEGLLGTNQNMIAVAYRIAENLEQQAYPPLFARQANQPILITTFVNNDNLNEASHFSRILQENISSRFVQMGYTVREIKLRNELNIEPGTGEIMLSRKLADVQPSQAAQAIGVGTYSLTNGVMYISAKLVDPDNANIISSTDYKIQLDKNMLAMFGLQYKQEDELEPIEEPQHSFITRLLY